MLIDIKLAAEMTFTMANPTNRWMCYERTTIGNIL